MHLKAFKGHLNILLGTRYIETFLKWFYSNSNTIHFVIENKDGDVLGYVVGARWGYQRELNKYLLKPGIWALVTHPWVVFNRRILETIWLRIKTLFGKNTHIKETSVKYEKPIVSLVGIAVAEDARGQKVGGKLLELFEKSALELGFVTMRLSVYRLNHRARAFYEKYGWKEESSQLESRVMGYYKEI